MALSTSTWSVKLCLVQKIIFKICDWNWIDPFIAFNSVYSFFFPEKDEFDVQSRYEMSVYHLDPI